MARFYIEHREELIGRFYVDNVSSEEEALEKYNHLVNEGRIDFGDLEMIDSSDKAIQEGTKDG